MILSGQSHEAPASSAEHKDVSERTSRGLGHNGLSAYASEEDGTGYPSNIDSEGNYIVAIEPATGDVRQLKPGDIGYNKILDAQAATYHIPSSSDAGKAGQR